MQYFATIEVDAIIHAHGAYNGHPMVQSFRVTPEVVLHYVSKVPGIVKVHGVAVGGYVNSYNFLVLVSVDDPTKEYLWYQNLPSQPLAMRMCNRFVPREISTLEDAKTSVVAREAEYAKEKAAGLEDALNRLK